MITQAQLKELLNYNPDTGIFIWLQDGRGRYKRVGAIAGTINDRGYLQIGINCRRYRAHRLAWFYVHGYWPPNEIDHIDRDKLNNKLSNLRLATHAENCQNFPLRRDNKYGVSGITYHGNRRKKRWQAKIKINGVLKYMGYFSTLEEAINARKKVTL